MHHSDHLKDWIEFKRSFTQAQEDALWQYCMDHSMLQPNGYWGIQFYVRDVDDLWRRVYARYSGDYHRYEVEEKAARQRLVLSTTKSLAMSRLCEHIDAHGTWWEKLVRIAYTKLQRYLRARANVFIP